jgi:thioredoxin reductase
MTRRQLITQGTLALSALAIPFPLKAFRKLDPMTDSKNFDVIIIGGSYAGLSAAMALGRSLRKVLILDSGLPCNRQTPHSHNFITHDGETPAAIAAKAKEQVLKYATVQFLNELATAGRKLEDGFEITTQSGKTFSARKLVFATGIKDKMPDIKGFAECWGISVIHCPYCHGYEFRSQKTGIMANGPRAFHLAGLVSNLTDKVKLMTTGAADFDAEQKTRLQKHAIEIIETEIAEIVHEKGQVKTVVFKDGRREDFDAVYAAVPFTQHSDIPASLGCELTEQGYIKTDAFQKTNLEGVYACGDSSAMMRAVANAVYTGNLAGAMANRHLVEEEF